MSGFRRLRSLHKWFGVLAAIFLLSLAVTGFLLANKSRFAWMRPPEREGQEITGLEQTATLHQAAEAAFALGDPRLQTMKDIDRIDYRPKSNIFKVISKDGYLEVQVDGSTAKVLSSSFRNDQLSEDIHDLSYLGDWAHDWLLPLVAVALATLACTGFSMYVVPILRRRHYERTKKPG